MFYEDIVTWFFVVVVLVGLFLNARRHWSGFIFWMVSNVYWFWHTYRIGQHAQAVLFAVYFCFSAYGIWSWRKKQKQEREHNTIVNKQLSKLLHDNTVMAKYIRQTAPRANKKKKSAVVKEDKK